jgi:cysteine desulfurase
VQYIPHKNLEVNEFGADMVAFSAHKFHGPKGCGVLYVKKGSPIGKFVVGGEQERGMRGGTLNVPSVVGLAVALENCYQTTETRESKLKALRERFLKKVLALDGVYLNGGQGEDDLPSVMNLRFDGVENTSFLYSMDLNGIAVASGSACASASLKPSHVLTAMGLSESQAKSSIRFSIGRETTEEEIDFVAEKVAEILQKIRK